MANVASVPAGVATGWRPGVGNRPAPASRLNSWLRCKRRQPPCGAHGEKGTLGAAPLPGRPLSRRTPTRRGHPGRRPHCCALSGTRMPRAGRAPAEGGPAPGARSSRCLSPRPLAWRPLVPNFGAWAPRKGAARLGRPVLSPRPSRAAGAPTCGAGSPGTLEEAVGAGPALRGRDLGAGTPRRGRAYTLVQRRLHLAAVLISGCGLR
ncbi:putative uncharacterized protein C15orf56 homolog [Theropithecus gelada]|uniref:putative uncharacterized protein C15orf56 homolog n=1 Tax=Theropithecus gelada TaxID=9565 RepID=UPI000DC17B9E|nr:putative uncharacterized protein C15orf56 homolog [Theropithecus gelada]